MSEAFDPRIHVERRSGPDILTRTMRWVGLIGWLLMVAALGFMDKAKPESPFMIEKIFPQGLHYSVNIRTVWEQSLLDYMHWSMLLGFVLSMGGLMINSMRHRRKDDHYRIYLWLLGATSLAGLILYQVKFA